MKSELHWPSSALNGLPWQFKHFRCKKNDTDCSINVCFYSPLRWMTEQRKQSSLFRLSLNEHRFKCSPTILDLKEMAAFSAAYFYALVVLVHRKIRNSYSKNKRFFLWDWWILTDVNFKCAAVEPRSLNRNGTRNKISMCQRGDADRICMSPGTACMSRNEAVPWLLSASPIFLKAPQAAHL